MPDSCVAVRATNTDLFPFPISTVYWLRASHEAASSPLHFNSRHSLTLFPEAGTSRLPLLPGRQPGPAARHVLSANPGDSAPKTPPTPRDSYHGLQFHAVILSNPIYPSIPIGAQRVRFSIITHRAHAGRSPALKKAPNHCTHGTCQPLTTLG